MGRRQGSTVCARVIIFDLSTRAQLIKGVQSKQLGYLEILCWHLVEVGLLLPLGLPCAHDSLGQLAKAIEARLSKFIQLKQFHFRYTKEMIFDIVHGEVGR